MTVISIKRYLDFPPDDTSERTLALLVETVTQHPIAIDPVEYERFKGEVARIQQHFVADATDEPLLQATTAIGQALERHHRFIVNVVRRQADELQHMIDMLTQTVKSLGAASDTSARNLENIAGQLKRVSALEDIQGLRVRLAECLKHVCDEAARQRKEGQGQLQSLKHELVSSQQRMSRHGIEIDIDRVTGFAGRSAAEVAVHEATHAAEPHYVAVAVLGKMPAINSRFGYAVGDEVLCEFAARVAGGLCSHAAFFRWSGPTVIGILQRSDPIQVIRREVSGAAEVPMSKALVTGGQNAFITTSAVSTVIPVAPPASDVIARIDAFVAAQIPKEYAAPLGVGG